MTLNRKSQPTIYIEYERESLPHRFITKIYLPKKKKLGPNQKIQNKKCKLYYDRLFICDSVGEYKKTQVKKSSDKRRKVAKLFLII